MTIFVRRLSKFTKFRNFAAQNNNLLIEILIIYRNDESIDFDTRGGGGGDGRPLAVARAAEEEPDTGTTHQGEPRVQVPQDSPGRRGLIEIKTKAIFEASPRETLRSKEPVSELTALYSLNAFFDLLRQTDIISGEDKERKRSDCDS